MFSLSSANSFLLYRKIADFRKGFDGLCGLVRNDLNREPATGEVFIFINRRGDRIKLLQWQTGGYVLYYKRLERGTIEIPKGKKDELSCEVSWSDLVMMIEGISLEKVVRRARYIG
jgi:transposase